MPNFANHHRYMVKVRQLLLGAGIEGISQYNLNQAVRTRAFNVEDLMLILNEWEKREWVQQFKMKLWAKRPTTIWRATTKLRDEWNAITFDRPLPTATVAEEEIVPQKIY